MVFFLLLGFGVFLFGKDISAPSKLYFHAVRDPNPWLVSYPWRNYLRECFFSGEFPLWNPYNGLGEPFLANYQSGVFSFLRYPFYFLPFSLVMVPYLLFRLVFAGLGAWLFARKIGLKPASCLVVGMGFMGSGYLVQYLNNQHLVIDLLIPYSLLAGERILERASLKNFLLLAGVLVLIILGGQPGAGICTLGFAGAYFLFRSWSRGQLRASWIFLLGLFLALNFCWIQLLPFLEAIPQSWTYHPPGWAEAHLEIKTFASLLSPLIFGRGDIIPFPIQKTFPWLGVSVFVLALIQIFQLKNSRSIFSFFGLMVIFCLGIVYGLLGFNLIPDLPGFNRVSWFKYLQPIITFSALVLAGAGLEKAFSSQKKTPLAGIIIFVILITLFGWVYARGFPEIKYWANLGTILILLIAGTGFLSLYLLKNRAGKTILLGLIFLEPLLWHHTADRAKFWVNLGKAELGLFKTLSQKAGNYRVAGEPQVWIANQGLLIPFYDLSINDALIPERYLNLIYYLNHYQSEQELYNDFFAFHSLRLKESALENPLSQLLNLKYFVKKNPPGDKKFLTLAFSKKQKPKFTHTALYGDPLYLLEQKNPLKRFFFPQNLIRAENPKESFSLLLQLKEIHRQAVIEGYPEREKKILTFSQPRILNRELSRQRLGLEYQAEAPGFAVFVEQYYVGWKAYLDGREIKIYPADYLLRGVFLPAGEHRLEMRYEPVGFKIGLWGFLAGAIILLILFVPKVREHH